MTNTAVKLKNIGKHIESDSSFDGTLRSLISFEAEMGRYSSEHQSPCLMTEEVIMT